MADAGVKWGRLFFYKGFGLEYERPAMEQSKKAADQMHKLGIKVSLYMGGTMFTETLYRELPEAQGWEQRDQWDRPVPYGAQTYRHYACPNEPKHRDYLRKGIQPVARSAPNQSAATRTQRGQGEDCLYPGRRTRGQAGAGRGDGRES
jgi:hypothetical protein